MVDERGGSALTLAPVSTHLPALCQAVPFDGRRFWEFFTVSIRNPNTRRAYFKAVDTFAAQCTERGMDDLALVTPMHVAAYGPAWEHRQAKADCSTSPISAMSSPGKHPTSRTGSAHTQ